MVDHGDGHFAVHVGVVVLVLFAQHLEDQVEGLLHAGLRVRLLILGVQGHLHGAVHRGGEAQQLDAADALAEQDGRQLGLRGGLHGRGDAPDGVAVSGLAGRVGVDPGAEFPLLLLFAADDVQGLEGLALADPLLPAVGRSGILASILQTHLVIGAHGLPEHILTHAAGVDAHVVGGEHVGELGSGLEALRAARVAHDHGEIAFLHALERDVQELARTHRDIVGGVLGGLVVGTGVNAEHREIAGVARPHPVVRVAAELAGRCGRSAHEAHVAVYFGYNQVLDVVVVEADDAHLAVRILLFRRGDQVPAVLAGGQLVRHVGHALEEADGQARAGDFLFARQGEVAVLQIVVLRGGEGLDIAVSAVVVGHKQTAAGDDFGGAAAAELDDGILDGRMVYAVDLFRREAGADIAERVAVHLLEQRQEPHALIGAQGGRHQQEGGGEGKQDFLHISSNKLGSSSLGWKDLRCSGL